MNKRRLLLFSVFALLHITTSERNVLDGRYVCSNDVSRYLSSKANFYISESHQIQRILPEIRTLNTPENSDVHDTELTQLSRRRQIWYKKKCSRDNEIRDTFARQRNSILTSTSENIPGRQYFKETIDERNNDLQNNFRRNRFIRFRNRNHHRVIKTTSFSLQDNRQNVVTRNRFEDRDVSKYDYNREPHSRNARDNRNEVKRNTQRYQRSNRDTMINNFDYVKNVERKVSLQKSVFETIDHRKTNLRNIRTIRSDRENVISQLATDRIFQRGTFRNLNKELSQNELFKKTFVRNYVKDNQINKRSLVRSTDNLNYLTENQQRSECVHNRRASVINRGTSKLELRETSRRQRDNIENGFEKATRTRNYRRQNYDRFEVHRRKESGFSNRGRSYEEMYASRDVISDTRIQFETRNIKYNIRYNRDMKERDISEGKNGRFNIKTNRNWENKNYRQHLKETNKHMTTFEFRPINRDRYESSNIKYVNKYSPSVRRTYIKRAVERDNGRITRHNLSTKKFNVRNELRRSPNIQQSINDFSDRILRRNRREFSLAHERDESRQYLRELRYFIVNSVFTERRNQQQVDVRHDNIRQSFLNRFILNVPEDKNRITSRIQKYINTVRSIQIARTNVDNDFHQRSRNVSNEKILTYDRQNTRKDKGERKYNKINQEDKMATPANEKHYLAMDISGSKGFRTHDILYENNVLDIKWQYLFYALQFVYLYSILMQIPKNKEENKHKNRILVWLTTHTGYLKVD